MLFHYDNYENLSEINFFKTKSFDEAAEILHFLSCGEIGASIFFWTTDGCPVLRFCDNYLFYEYDLILAQCYTSELMEVSFTDPYWHLFIMSEIRDSLMRMTFK